METRKIWMRLGATVSGSKEEIEKVIEGDGEALQKLLDKGSFSVDGECYIPSCEIESYNEEYGTDHKIDDVDL